MVPLPYFLEVHSPCFVARRKAHVARPSLFKIVGTWTITPVIARACFPEAAGFSMLRTKKSFLT
jgi:hypothetical protein